MKKTASVAMAFLLLVAAGGTALAQSIMTTALRGHVESPDGQGLPGVSVSITAPDAAGDPHDGDLRQRRLHLRRPPAG